MHRTLCARSMGRIGAGLATLMTALLVALAGCSSTEPAHDDHLEHHVPEHRPRDLRRAIVQIDLRYRAVTAAMKSSQPTADDQLKMLLDIVRWLPEIAGDSDLAETPWNEVDAVSQQLAEGLEQASSAQTLERLVALEPLVKRSLERLEQAAAQMPPDKQPSSESRDP